MSKTETLAFIFPGQGAQYPGMGRDFYDKFASSRYVFDEADRILQRPFSKCIFEGTKEELTQTQNSQLAIFITSLAILRAFEELCPNLKPDVCAGLSLGEYTALVAAGILRFEEGVKLVEKRAEAMQRACDLNPGSLKVVLGLKPEVLKEAIAPYSKSVWIANLNCPGQVVIAGTPEGLESVTEPLKEAGAKRVLPLDVSGAFHSKLMLSAQESLAPHILAANLCKADVGIVMNTPGDYVTDLDAMRSYMIQQVTHPVLYQKGIEAMSSRQIKLFVEMGPGKTLQGMNKKIGASGLTKSLEKVSELEEFAKSEEVSYVY